jgi:hypothetical protein
VIIGVVSYPPAQRVREVLPAIPATAILTAKPVEPSGRNGRGSMKNLDLPTRQYEETVVGRGSPGFVISSSAVRIRAPALKKSLVILIGCEAFVTPAPSPRKIAG